MKNDNRQYQKSGDNSTNIQIQKVVINGITHENIQRELMQIFLDNMPILREIAKETANERAEELNRTFIEKILKQDERIIQNIFEKLSEPDMQISIFEAQKTYAKSGDKNKLDTLTDILISKSREKTETTTKMVLDEALKIIAKINKTQIDILVFMFIFLCLRRVETKDINIYLSALEKDIKIIENIQNVSRHNLIFLEQIGCIKIMETITQHDIYRLLYNANQIKNIFNMSLLQFKNTIDERFPIMQNYNKIWTNNGDVELNVYSSTANINRFDLTLIGKTIAAIELKRKGRLGKDFIFSFDN